MDEQEAPQPVKNWLEGLDERTRKHIRYARHYQARFSHGAPGHLDLETIATLARYIDFLTDQDTSDEAPKTQPNLLTPAEAKPIDLSRPPDASKRPGGFA